jgi:PAS domain S-box-containing protein
MKKISNPNKKRILIIDDNIQIHQDFKKVLLISKEKESDLDKLEKALLGKTSDQQAETYSIDYASQGEEGLKLVEESIRKKEPYAVAFIDVRMPPGWDGIETISRIWEIYPELQVVICTAYSDYSWEELFNKFGNTDKLLILKKPFDNIEVRQLTYTLSKKWELNRIANLKLNELEKNVEERTKELQQSEEKYRTMIEHSNDMIWTLDTKGNFMYFNKKSEEITGYDVKKGVGETFSPIILEEDLEMVYNVFKKTLQGTPQHYEVRIHDVTKTKIITLSVNTAPIIKDGKVTGTVSFGRDITESKQEEQIQLVLYNIAKAVNTTKNLDEFYHTIHQLLSTVIDTTNLYIALYDEDKNIISFPYYIDEKDPKPDPVPQKLSKGLTEYVIRTGKSLLAPKEYYMRLMKEGKIEISGSISEVWIGIPLRIEKKIIGVMALQSYKDPSIYNEKDLEILEFISYQIAIAIEHKKTEQINLRLSQIIRNARDGIILTNTEGQITYVNPAFEKMSGYKMNELLNTDLDILIVKQDKTAPNGAIRSVVKTSGEWRGELYCKRKNGEIYPIDTRVFAIKNAIGEIVEIAAIQQDITERKHAEEALRESEKQLQTLIDAMPDFVCFKDGDGRWLKVNDACIRIFQLEDIEYRGKKDSELAELNSKLRGSFLTCKETDARAWKEGGLIRGEETVPDYDGSVRVFDVTKVSVSHPDGERKGLVVIGHDITEHKRADEELKISRERLKTANSILRHDIANDVIVMKSALDIYRDEQDETMLDEIEKRVEKSLNTIKKQRDQEKFIDSHAALDEYDMEKVVHDVSKNFPDIKINVTGTGRAYADNAIYSVFENIISNAIKHGKTTKLDIDISSGEDYFEIRFTDYGIGIPDEMKDKIFDEGFQYGETGHTGIGLYIVQQTVEEYDGEVFVEDNKPNGAVFIIRLRKIIER